MMEEQKQQKQGSREGLFDIGAVARLTGISAPNLRMWEKRHGVVTPIRSETGRRLYTADDVRRLTLLKALSDRGHAIRTTATLTAEDLESRLLGSDPTRGVEAGRNVSHAEPKGSCRVVVAGLFLPKLLRKPTSEIPGIRIIAEFPDLDSIEACNEPHMVDLIIVECPVLFDDTADRVCRLAQRLRAVRAIIVYRYSTGKTLETLESESRNVTAIRGPMTLADLRVACAADVALAKRAAEETLSKGPKLHSAANLAPPREFTDDELAKISAISTAVECECPQHIADILSGLNAFENYSAECKHRNTADAEIHAYLHRMTGHARATIEQALKVVLDFEGIQLKSKYSNGL